MKIKDVVPRQALRLNRRPPVSLSKKARQRLKWLDWHRAHGRNVSLTCRHFGISRSTFYLWQKRFNPRDLTSLEDHSCRPKRVRRPTWAVEVVIAVRRLREQYPRWGKDKLAVLLAREGLPVSVSMVGRILCHLKRTGQLVEPLIGRVKARKRARGRAYAVRKPKEYMAREPGDIVQVDTLDVYPLPGVALKHFTARDVVSRWDVVTIRSRATSLAAKTMLAELLERMPFPVRALQVDGGSEFMKEFEEGCQAKGIALYVLPPRSPKLNGHVERAHRTHQEEFYEVTEAEPTVAALRSELSVWEHTYNTVRPHQALGYKTPKEFLQATNRYQPRKEALYGRC